MTNPVKLALMFRIWTSHKYRTVCYILAQWKKRMPWRVSVSKTLMMIAELSGAIQAKDCCCCCWFFLFCFLLPFFAAGRPVRTVCATPGAAPSFWRPSHRPGAEGAAQGFVLCQALRQQWSERWLGLQNGKAQRVSNPAVPWNIHGDQNAMSGSFGSKSVWNEFDASFIELLVFNRITFSLSLIVEKENNCLQLRFVQPPDYCFVMEWRPWNLDCLSHTIVGLVRRGYIEWNKLQRIFDLNMIDFYQLLINFFLSLFRQPMIFLSLWPPLHLEPCFAFGDAA